ncbi:hypothetical protein B9Z55_013105 [Caenorhabditis nigoni]|nr:hypothetical protein B9Z55_013105 [Caenorhabditis nigoni]
MFKILSIFSLLFTISFARPNEMLSGVVNTALGTVHNVAEAGTGAVQGVIDGVVPAAGAAVETVGGVVQGVASLVPELPIGAPQQPSK